MFTLFCWFCVCVLCLLCLACSSPELSSYFRSPQRLWSYTKTHKKTKNNEHLSVLTEKKHIPVLCDPTFGLKSAFSSLCCRQSSSSYSAIVLSNRSIISSAAKLSRLLTKPLSVWTFFELIFLQTHSVKNTMLTLMQPSCQWGPSFLTSWFS